jgi:ribosomal protein S18 acetylase RimI-like enzyme
VTPYTLRPIAPTDREVVTTLLTKDWGAVVVYALALGELVDASALPGFLAEQDGEVVGLLTYRPDTPVADVVTLNAYRSGGIGTDLIQALAAELTGTDATRIRVVTTNDNTDALRFYQRCGFHLRVLRPGAVTDARRVKPAIPEVGHHGIPIRDELELELQL